MSSAHSPHTPLNSPYNKHSDYTHKDWKLGNANYNDTMTWSLLLYVTCVLKKMCVCLSVCVCFKLVNFLGVKNTCNILYILGFVEAVADK